MLSTQSSKTAPTYFAMILKSLVVLTVCEGMEP